MKKYFEENRWAVELVGLISIVASLIFVGFQLRQDRTLAMADIYANRSESRSANLRTLLESETGLIELAEYRKQHLVGPNFSLPENWKNEEAPTVAEARRLRNELNILAWDNWFYQGFLGLIDDTQIKASVEENFRADPGLMEYALRQTWTNEYTRNVFREAAERVKGK